MSLRVMWSAMVRQSACFLGVCALLVGVVRAEAGTYLGPIDVVASPDQKLLYVVNLDGQRIDVVDAATNQVARSIPCPAAPTGLAVTADGSKLLVTSGVAQGVVSTIEASTGNVLGTIAVGHSPCSPVLVPNSKFLAVCNKFHNNVSIVDLETGKEVTRVPVLRQPVAADATPDGATVFVANLLPTDAADAETVAAEISMIQMADLSVASIRLAQRKLECSRCVCVAGWQVRVRCPHLVTLPHADDAVGARLDEHECPEHH